MRKLGLMGLAVLIISAGLFTGLERAEAATNKPHGTYPVSRVDDRGIVSAEYPDNMSPNGQVKENAFDNSLGSKWLVVEKYPWIQYQFADNQAYVINSYSITSAEDAPDRDPLNWTLQGSNDGVNWTDIDTRQDIDFEQRNQLKSFTISNPTSYSYYKFDFESVGGWLQLAEIKLYNGEEQTYTYTSILPSITASSENSPNERKENAIDGTSNTKWLTFENNGWLELDYGVPILLDGYSIAAANDSEERDPKQWILRGSNDGNNWTQIDTKDNENFLKRHQRNHYFVNPSTAYQYYRLELQNNSGDILQVGDVALSYTNDMWHSINPIVEYRNLDTGGNGDLFQEVLPNYEQEVIAIVRDIVSMLYDDPGQFYLNHKKINIATHTTNPNNAPAWATHSGREVHIGMDSNYIRRAYDAGKLDPSTPVKEELIGMLYHELTHGYQISGPGYIVEGLADGVRTEFGYHDRYQWRAEPNGTWMGGYSTTGNFLRWINDNKHEGFLRDINASTRPSNGVWTKDAFKTLTGEEVESLWDQYQQSYSTGPTPTITVSGENTPNGRKENAIDGNSNTKWQTNGTHGWLELDYGVPILIDGYSITAANDLNVADPKNWTLRGSNDGITWRWLVMKENEIFSDRQQEKRYDLNPNTFDNATFRYYRLELQNNGGDKLQVAEVKLSIKK
ncbi:discoidin domain-containing protein [Paenibacillus glacialis]|uniref:F5/8 type C domain-containing protein n=1 Tax=Paenibacillus glacialis TaxID=494026 RepID=A0A168NPK0_9BACL|nr:discoidin domain-containing protein [Paenibacillus glacialis]OAB46002.1 hypothetical protein PGLA_00980 [Paenibacillus glacialis]